MANPYSQARIVNIIMKSLERPGRPTILCSVTQSEHMPTFFAEIKINEAKIKGYRWTQRQQTTEYAFNLPFMYVCGYVLRFYSWRFIDRDIPLRYEKNSIQYTIQISNGCENVTSIARFYHQKYVIIIIIGMNWTKGEREKIVNENK